jgi:hypothetical protein
MPSPADQPMANCRERVSNLRTLSTIITNVAWPIDV